MSYAPQTWVNGSGGGTPVSAARLTYIENGIQATAVVADAAIAAPSSPSANDVLVYSSGWTKAKLVNANIDPAAAVAYSKLSLASSIVNADISSGAAIGVTKIASGSAGQTLKTLGGATGWSCSYLTTAQFAAYTPAGDGDEVFLIADASNGILWHLRYDSAEATYKWRFLGGTELFNEITTQETTGSTTYAALATGGPSIAVPFGGDYMIGIGATILRSASTATSAYMSYDIGGTGAVDADAVQAYWGVNDGGSEVFRYRRKAGLTAVTLTSKYRAVTGASASFANRWMAVRPVRIAQT